MKKIVLLLVLGGMFAQVHAQNGTTKTATTTATKSTTTTAKTTSTPASTSTAKSDGTPAAVTAAFAKAYPTVKDATWSKDGANYVATFTADNKMSTAVSYDANGALQHVKAKIDPTTLPATATDYAKKNYATLTISKAFKMTDSKNVVTYDAKLSDGSTLHFDSNGTFTKVDKAVAKAPAKPAPKANDTKTTTKP